MTLQELIKDKTYDCVKHRVTLTSGGDIYAGSFRTENGEIIPLEDGFYALWKNVVSYELWSDEKTKRGMTVVVEGDWFQL